MFGPVGPFAVIVSASPWQIVGVVPLFVFKTGRVGLGKIVRSIACDWLVGVLSVVSDAATEIVTVVGPSF